MASTAIELNAEQQLSSPEQADLLVEISRLQRLSDLAAEGAQAMTAASLKAFAMVRDGEPRANLIGAAYLDFAEKCFVDAKSWRDAAEALWLKLGR